MTQPSKQDTAMCVGGGFQKLRVLCMAALPSTSQEVGVHSRRKKQNIIKSFARGPIGDVGATEALGNVPKL